MDFGACTACSLKVLNCVICTQTEVTRLYTDMLKKKGITVNLNEMYRPFLVECQSIQGPRQHENHLFLPLSHMSLLSCSHYHPL